MEPRQKAEILRNCSFLAGVGTDILTALAHRTESVAVSSGETIVTKGEEGSAMFFIASGRVRVHDGEVVLAHLDEGEVFGEMAVLDEDVRSASVSAEEDTDLLSLERDVLWQVISNHPETLKTIIAAVMQRERGIVHDVTARTEQLLSYEKELEIGRRIQAGFLPPSVPQPDNWEIAPFFEAAREVAGDFYDVFELKPSRYLALIIGDVCDKGVGAALFMTLFRSLIRATCQFDMLVHSSSSGEDLSAEGISEVLGNSVEATNRYVATTHGKSSMFASVFFGMLDPTTGELFYVNAGHESPVIYRAAGGAEILDVTGGVMGLFPWAKFTIASVELQPGDLLFSYTDGVNEAKDTEGDQFGDERIVDNAELGRGGAGEFVSGMLEQIKSFRGEAPQSDDITMLAVRRLGGA